MVVVAVAALVSVFVVASPQPAEALSGSEFDPGHIISDSLFYDGNAMTEAEIQGFLTAASGTCKNSYCLAVHRATTTTTSAGFGPCATYQGAADESAARM
ncbi:MAG: N-acetylmuramoyl-L-alanine amidase, partial [Cryobacterium sp.]|nr:N-acetylmuramoyl-L-alanine amidase [Cryobacterium sp.]